MHKSKKKTDLMVIAVETVSISALTTLMMVLTREASEWVRPVVRSLFGVVLMWFLYKENEWARMISVVLFGIAGIIMVKTVFSPAISGASALGAILIVAMGIYYGGAAVYLVRRKFPDIKG